MPVDSPRQACACASARVALQCGNSPNIIFQHYREQVTPEQAQEWFNILPFVACARQKQPGIVNRVRGANLIPGLISRDKSVRDNMLQLCRDLGQGDKYPGAMEPPGGPGQKQKGKQSTGAHHLVMRLWEYIERLRDMRQWNPLYSPEGIAKQKDDGLVVSPLLETIFELSPLDLGTWKAWREIGRRILDDHTGGALFDHPAFRAGGFYQDLGGHQKTEKEPFPRFRKGMDKAWMHRAEEMEALRPHAHS